MANHYCCPCCGQPTYPVAPENALAYICPVCYWENDLFVHTDDEPSDENRQLTLNQARENYREFGISDPWLLENLRR